jgi:hypothetical protein
MLKFILFFFAALLLIGCDPREYAGYVQIDHIQLYEVKEANPGDDVSIIKCYGPGDDCEVGGYYDGLVIHWDRQVSYEGTIYDTIYLSASQKAAFIDAVQDAYRGNYLDELANEHEYSAVFAKSADRSYLISKLKSYEYKLIQRNDNCFSVYSGNITDNPRIIYQTMVLDPTP